MSNDLKELKSIIRSLLIANGKRDTTLGALNGMYREELETDIPFRKYNFSNLAAFLCSMPDTVRLQHSKDGELCAYHVVSEKSAHISSLVARQRKPAKRSSKTSNRFKYRPSYPHTRPSVQQHHIRPLMEQHHTRPPVQQHHIQPLIQHQTRPPVQQHNFTSFNVLCKVLEEFENLPSRQPKCGMSKFDLLNYVRSRLGRYMLYTEQNLNVDLNQLQYKLVEKDNYIYFKNELKDIEISKSINPLCQNSVTSNNFNNPTKEMGNIFGQNSICNGKQNLCHKMDEKFPKKNSIDSTSTEMSENATSKSTDVSDNVTSKSSEMSDNAISKSKEISDNVTSKTILNSNQEQTFFENESNHKNEDQDLQFMKENSVTELIKDRTKIRLQKLIEKHPEGIWCSELPYLYKEEYKLDLEYNELGFNNINEFVAALPDIFLIVEPPNTNRQMVLDAKKSFNGSNDDHQKKTMASNYNFDDYIPSDPEPVPIKLSSEVSQMLIPEGVMGFDETVDQINVTSLESEDYIEVLISEIFTPSFFWLILRKNKKKRKTMMAELDEFYRRKDLDAYKIPQVVLKPGLNIACIYAKLWHRGIIKKIKPDGFVVVFFYDYGTVKTYNPYDLYFLSKKFSVLPAQAIACGLYNLRPIESKEWPQESVTKFVNKVWDLPLMAMISTVNEDTNSMMITLTDTSDDVEDLHISDWMVENKLAEWGKMVSSVPLHKLYIYDELVYQKLRDEENRSQKPRINITSNIEIQSNQTEDVDIKESSVTSTIPNSIYTDFSDTFNPANVATLVKENMDLTKQTNTICQAILLNSTINASNVNNKNNIDAKNTEKIDIKLPLSERLNKKVTTDVNSNSSTIKVNISARNNNYFATEFTQNECTHPMLKPKENYYSSSQSSLSHHPSVNNKFIPFDNTNTQTEFMQSKSTVCERRPSINSVYSNQSNFDSQSAQDQDLNENVADPFQENNGCPYYEIEINSDLTKSKSINIKYPFNFAELNINEIDNNIITNGNNEIIHENKKGEIDEGYATTKHSTSETYSKTSSSFSSIKPNIPVYTVTYLSNRCKNKPIHIFHIENEGWICVDEFIDAFTNLKDQRVMIKLLQFLHYEIKFKVLFREKESQLFSELDQSLFKTCESSKKSSNNDLTLLPLKSMLPVLKTLEFLDETMLKEAVPMMKHCQENVEDLLFEMFQNRILYDALNLVLQYKHFKRLHRSMKKF